MILNDEDYVEILTTFKDIFLFILLIFMIIFFVILQILSLFFKFIFISFIHDLIGFDIIQPNLQP
jgi:hypothetical protein